MEAGANKCTPISSQGSLPETTQDRQPWQGSGEGIHHCSQTQIKIPQWKVVVPGFRGDCHAPIEKNGWGIWTLELSSCTVSLARVLQFTSRAGSDFSSSIIFCLLYWDFELNCNELLLEKRKENKFCLSRNILFATGTAQSWRFSFTLMLNGLSLFFKKLYFF